MTLAPPRFLAFLLIAVVSSAGGVALLGWREGVMAGFDGAALVFLATCLPLLDDEPDEMRAAAARNDGNRLLLLAVTGCVMLVLLAAIGAELGRQRAPGGWSTALIIATLALAWLFSNSVYAIHYARLFYGEGDDGDRQGLTFPDTDEPDYSDFVYFAFCLGMTFQTSDVAINDRPMRRAVTLHCLAAFVFNLGVLAFSINVLGS